MKVLGVSEGYAVGTDEGYTNRSYLSQIIALDIGQYSPIPIIIGLILSFIARSEKLSKTSKSILYFGILFFGLYTMERAVEPLRDDSRFCIG